MIGKSPAFLKTFNLIQKLGNSDNPVLIEGEAGTGKALAAHAIHEASARKKAPFVELSCGSVPDAQFESELLAHTSDVLESHEENIEIIECADGGTLFLNEVESLPPQGQAALFRFLQNQQNAVNVQDVRIIVACNGNLSPLVAKGAFRRDLYNLLAPMHLKMPALRDRPGDAALLASYFLKCCAVRYGTERYLGVATLEWMEQYRWPGNICELENIISREYLIADKTVINISSPAEHGDKWRKQTDKYPESVTMLNFSQAKKLAISEFERNYLDKILTTTEGNVTRAAKLVGKERRSLGKLLKKYGIDRHQYEDRAGADTPSAAISSKTATLPAWIPTAGLQEAQPSPLLRG